MKTKLPIEELVAKVLKELERLNYAQNTICGFRCFFKRVVSFAREKNEPYFSEKLGRDFLKEKYGCMVDYYTHAMPRSFKAPIRAIRILGDFQLHGVIVRRIVKKIAYVKPPQFEKELTAYEKYCSDNDYSKRGLRTRMQRLFFFIDYLDTIKVQSVCDIDAGIISDYVKTICHHHEKSMASILTTLKMFLKFLYLNRYTETDLSLKVPKHTRYYYPPVPSVWERQDVLRMLKIIDRANPAGKRDYAILLMVARLGIRVGDIKSLKLSQLNWEKKIIEITQHKTKRKITYPILSDIGWALIDYLKNGRPKSNSPFVFIRLKAPFKAFGKDANLHNIITKYTRKAGIKIPREKRHGLHSLRHTLASNLLESGATLNMISEVLGHVNSKSAGIYLNTETEGLRQCALDPEEVFSDV
jgi:integrase/recombinase XerD